MPHCVIGCGRENDDEFSQCFQGCACAAGSCSIESCCPCILRFGAAYDTHWRLVDLLGVQPVVECSSCCLCNDLCTNRTVQRGVRVRLQVFDAGPRGLGVRSLDPVAKGQFICEYAGELISAASAGRRYKYRGSSPNYILALCESFGSSHKTRVTYIDATYVGNVGRLLNHSCNPNLTMIPVRICNDIPVVAFFALVDIAACVELTYDYSGGSETEPAASVTNIGNRKKCLCGASKCRMFIPFDMSFA
jgi:[histone H3]-lysine36 N-dimethyltransferase SETMAR